MARNPDQMGWKWLFPKIGWLSILLLATLLSGCWDLRELDNLALVFGIGVELTPEGDGHQLTFELVRARQIQSPGAGVAGGGQRNPYWLLQATGPTVFEAIRNATLQSSRRLFLSHTQVFIISEELAKGGISPVLDFIVRDHEPRIAKWLLLTPDDPMAIFAAEPGLEQISAVAIAELIQNYAITSKIKPVRVVDYLETRLYKTSANTLPIIRIRETAGKKELIIDRTGVIKGDKLVGYLNPTETRGLLWVQNEVGGGVITFEAPGGKGQATLELFNTDTKVTVESNDHGIQVKIVIKVQSGLGGQTGSIDLFTTGQIARLEKRQAEAIRKEIRAALTKAQELKADIFGFGEYLYRHDHRSWQRLKRDWERHFVGAEVEVLVETRVEEVGLITKAAI
jgi:spore germination protein KC